MKGFPARAGSDAIAAAWAINNGTDIEMGSFCLLDGLQAAVIASLTTEAKITASARRSLAPLFRAGRFDKTETVEWSKYGAEVRGWSLPCDLNSCCNPSLAAASVLMPLLV